MRKPTRRLRFLVRLGFGLSALIVVTWAVTLWVGVTADTRHFHGGIGGGGFGFSVLAPTVSSEPGVSTWFPNTVQWMPEAHRHPYRDVDFYMFIPFWCPLVVLLVPTLILFRRVRAKPPGCCRSCGYDLTGNTTGTCPECGARDRNRPIPPR